LTAVSLQNASIATVVVVVGLLAQSLLAERLGVVGVRVVRGPACRFPLLDNPAAVAATTFPGRTE